MNGKTETHQQFLLIYFFLAFALVADLVMI